MWVLLYWRSTCRQQVSASLRMVPDRSICLVWLLRNPHILTKDTFIYLAEPQPHRPRTQYGHFMVAVALCCCFSHGYKIIIRSHMSASITMPHVPAIEPRREWTPPAWLWPSQACSVSTARTWSSGVCIVWTPVPFGGIPEELMPSALQATTFPRFPWQLVFK